MEIGEDGVPHGVVIFRVAACVKPGRCCRPVPPMTAMGTVSDQSQHGHNVDGRTIVS